MWRDETGRLRTVWRVGIFLTLLAWAAWGLMYGFAWFRHLAGIESKAARLLLYASAELLAALGLVALLRFRLDRRSLVSLGLGRPLAGWRVSLLAGVFVGLAPVALLAGIVLLAGAYGMELNGAEALSHAAAWTPAFVLGAFVEELLTRGYLLRNFVEVRQVVLGVIVSSAVFALFHFRNPGVRDSLWPMTNLLLGGVLLAQFCLLARNLWLPVALHFGWNFCQGVVLDIPVSGLKMEGLIHVEAPGGWPDWVTGGAFGLEGSAVVAMLQLIPIAALAWWLARRGRLKKEMVCEK